MKKIKFPKKIKIGKRWVGEGQPALIIADIGANFDGNFNLVETLGTEPRETPSISEEEDFLQNFLSTKIRNLF